MGPKHMSLCVLVVAGDNDVEAELIGYSIYHLCMYLSLSRLL